jgi:hypothetical protein
MLVRENWEKAAMAEVWNNRGRFVVVKEYLAVDDLNAQISALLEEIEFFHVKRVWVERLIAAGIPEREALKWATDVGHVVDEYKNSLRELMGLIQEDDPDRLLAETRRWADSTQDTTALRLEEAARHLLERVSRYAPPEDEDDLF